MRWVVRAVAAFFKPKASLGAENLCLRQQILVLQRKSFKASAATIAGQGSSVLDPGIPVAPALAKIACDRDTGNGSGMAPKGLESLLALAFSAQRTIGTIPVAPAARKSLVIVTPGTVLGWHRKGWKPFRRT